MGLFSISIPWFSLGRSPVVIRVEDVHVVIGPSKATSYDPEDVERRSNAVKMEKLERAEAMNFNDAADGGAWPPHTSDRFECSDSSETSSWGLFGIDFQTLLSGFVNNVQVYVNSVHARYEDSQTVPGVSGSRHILSWQKQLMVFLAYFCSWSDVVHSICYHNRSRLEAGRR